MTDITRHGTVHKLFYKKAAGTAPPSSLGSGGVLKKNEEGSALLKKVSSSTAVHHQSFFSQMITILTGSHLNIMLLAVPLSFLSYYGGWSDTMTFATAFFSLVPLAALLGTFTEDLALRSNEAVGALLNATFGNATEMIISIFALKEGLYSVIQNSLMGSVLGNMLLVLGCSLLVGGIYNNDVSFNSDASNVYCSLLLLASLGLLIPTTFNAVHGATVDSTLSLSRQISVCMCVGYILYLFFQLRTHKEMFNSAKAEDEEDEEEEEVPQFSALFGLIGLAFVTVIISFESEFLVGSLEPFAIACGLSKAFIGVILLPIVGNAAEHSTAVVMAMRGKIDISLGVAVGSSIQIALFVVPALVIISWIMGLGLDLNFQPFSALMMVVSVIIVNSLVYDGHSHWLEGALLLLAYAMLALSYLHTAD